MVLTKMKKIVDEHPLFVLIGVFCLGAATAAYPIQAVSSANDAKTQNLKAEIDRLNTELGAVTISVGPHKTTDLRVDRIVISGSQAEDLSPSLDYMQADDIYAPSLKSDADWSFTASDEAGFTQMQGLASRKDYEKAYGSSIAHNRINIWHSSDITHVETSQGTLTAFPSVSVERIDKVVLTKEIAKATGSSDLTNFMEDDPVGAMFQLNVVDLAAVSTAEGITAVLGGIQRAGNALYCDVTLVFRNVKVNGVKTSRFYYEHEMLFLEAGNDVVEVQALLPSTDRRGIGAPVVTELLEGLRVVA
jgi:hypothetical protein